MNGEVAPNPIANIQAGDVIEFADITELPAFEDMVADIINPQRTERERERWAGRAALGDLIRPPKFNGKISDVRLHVMDEPYARLIDARMRGWQVSSGSFERCQAAQPIVQLYRGFVLTANAKSSGRGIIGQIQTELWYYPTPGIRDYNSWRKNQIMNGGAPVRRVTAKPKIEAGNFINLHEQSRKVGFAVLRKAMSQPIIQPMRN